MAAHRADTRRQVASFPSPPRARVPWWAEAPCPTFRPAAARSVPLQLQLDYPTAPRVKLSSFTFYLPHQRVIRGVGPPATARLPVGWSARPSTRAAWAGLSARRGAAGGPPSSGIGARCSLAAGRRARNCGALLQPILRQMCANRPGAAQQPGAAHSGLL